MGIYLIFAIFLEFVFSSVALLCVRLCGDVEENPGPSANSILNTSSEVCLRVLSNI